MLDTLDAWCSRNGMFLNASVEGNGSAYTKFKETRRLSIRYSVYTKYMTQWYGL